MKIRGASRILATFFFLRDSTYVYGNSVCLKPFDPLNLLCQSLRFLKLCSIRYFLTLKHPIFHVTGIIEIVFEPKPCLEKPKNKPKFRFYHCPPNCHQQATEQHPVKMNYKLGFVYHLMYNPLKIIRNFHSKKINLDFGSYLHWLHGNSFLFGCDFFQIL